MILQANNLNLSNPPRPTNAAPERLSEARLLSEAKRGRSEAFEALCQALTPRLFKAAFHITRNREDAEDALQDALMRAFMHIKSFHGNSTFSTWLTRIVINSALMIRRKRRNGRQVSTDEPRQSGETGLTLQIPDHSPIPNRPMFYENAHEFCARLSVGSVPAFGRSSKSASSRSYPCTKPPGFSTFQWPRLRVASSMPARHCASPLALRAIAKARTEPAA